MRVQNSVNMKSELFLISNVSSVSILHRAISFLTPRVTYLRTFFEFLLAAQIISSNTISYFCPRNNTLKIGKGLRLSNNFGSL